MRYFNVDQHISVIADIRHILGGLLQWVDDISLSGHCNIIRRRQSSIPELDGGNWLSVVSQHKYSEFWNKYKDQLQGYDAFIACYPPLFARLYDDSKKPIIIVAPIRYELGADYSAELWEEFNEWIIDRCGEGRLILAANNKYDCEYLKCFTGIEPLHLPSLCEYTGMRYFPTHNKFLYFAPGTIEDVQLRKLMVRKYDVLQAGHSWQSIAAFKGIVHFPYNISLMSLFEQYTANIPLFFPSIKFLMELYSQGVDVLKQISIVSTDNKKPGSIVPFRGRYDPNDYKDLISVQHWLLKADYYDEEWMPHIQYFDSGEHLAHLLNTVNLMEISEKMRVTNLWRRREVYQRWANVMEKVRQFYAAS